MKINRVIRILILSDILIFSGFSLLTPIYAIFVDESIQGANLVTVGIAEAIYLGTKSLLQIPLGILVDKTKGERIDFWMVFGGTIIMSFATLSYVFATLPVHIYLIEFVVAVGGAISYPAWMGFFTRNLEKGRESTLWGTHSTLTELSSALAAFVGGILAEKFGFGLVFICVAIFGFLGSSLLFLTYPKLKKG